MNRTVGIGIDHFEEIVQKNLFYVDKTHFIREWWENEDKVTLITRPRRFGKTLNMSMLSRFFSNRYDDQEELFSGFGIWKEKKYRTLAGSLPVISLSFANIKEPNCPDALSSVEYIIKELFRQHAYLLDSDVLSASDKDTFRQMTEKLSFNDMKNAVHLLSEYLCRHFGKKVLIFLDEYDTPMQEAYVSSYWQEFTSFIRSLFNATFKTNPYLDKAVLTGITRVSKESIFSDLNNLKIITTTSAQYANCFGFTEEEVFAAMDEIGLSDKESVKKWYDGFTFGSTTDIYNPWSIINYLKDGRIAPYWANSSSNSLVGKLIREGDPELKISFEKLLNGESIRVPIDEELVYDQLDEDETAVWSLLLATGYLKVLHYQTGEEYGSSGKPMFELVMTNYEVRVMFCRMVSQWFGQVRSKYNYFVKALLADNLDEMNEFMETVTEEVFSFFDTERRQGKPEPERFYHGFILGLIVELSGHYIIKSNRESGYGRYDVMLYPKDLQGNGIIMEFKKKKEDDLEATVQEALKQIEEKNYAAELKSLGFAEENIKKYGFAFEGKKVLIGRS